LTACGLQVFYERFFMNDKLYALVERLHALMDRVELVLPRPMGAPDWSASVAFRYRKRASGHGALEPVAHVAPLRLDDLKEIDPQKEKIQQAMEKRALHIVLRRIVDESFVWE
jgi:predicted AAA+ superfamily ATPase